MKLGVEIILGIEMVRSDVRAKTVLFGLIKFRYEEG